MAVALTSQLGSFTAALRFSDIPAEALDTIRMAFADCIGCAIAGAAEPSTKCLQATLPASGDEATLIGSGRRTSARDAALVNGTASHALDYDDVARRGGHPSASLVPAILAEAEATGASGEQMLLAYAAGFEVFADLARRDADGHHDKGWHPTSVFGSLGAAAACASLRGLDAHASSMALGIAASQSSGIVSNFGSMTKPLHAGLAAQAGLFSARLAGNGFTAADDAIEHQPGLLTAVSPAGRMDLDSQVRAGREWQIVSSNRIGIKKYPACYGVHLSLDGILDLLAKHPVSAQAVQHISVSYNPRNVTLLRNHSPQTGLEAKFSIEFAMACAVIAQRAGLAELSDDFVQRADVQALMKRVSAAPDTVRLNPERPGYALCDQVVIDLADGQRLDTGPITQIRGDADLPLTHDALWIKFDDCVHAGDSELPARRLFDMLMSLETISHVEALMSVFRSSATRARAGA